MDNTYIQDSTIPIYIFLEYQNTLGHPNLIKFPINPESLEKGRISNSSKTKVEGVGEVSVPEYPNLATISIKSFFWQDKNLLPSCAQVCMFLGLKNGKKVNFLQN